MEMRACCDAGFVQLEQPLGASPESPDPPVEAAAEVQSANDIPVCNSPTFIAHEALVSVRGLRSRQRPKLTVSEEEGWDKEDIVISR